MDTKALSKRLKYVREQVLEGISQPRLAALVTAAGYEVSSASVMRYEGGDRDAPSGYLQALATVANVDPGWLLAGVGEALRPREEQAEAPAPATLVNGGPAGSDSQSDGIATGLRSRLDAIEALDVDELVKLVKVEALSAATRAEAALIEATAAATRARAVERAEIGSLERAVAIRQAEESAARRSLVLNSDANTPARAILAVEGALEELRRQLAQARRGADSGPPDNDQPTAPG